MTVNVLGLRLRTGDVVESDLIHIEHLAARLERIQAAPSRDWRGRLQRRDDQDIQIAAQVIQAFVERCRKESKP